MSSVAGDGSTHETLSTTFTSSTTRREPATLRCSITKTLLIGSDSFALHADVHFWDTKPLKFAVIKAPTTIVASKHAATNPFQQRPQHLLRTIDHRKERSFSCHSLRITSSLYSQLAANNPLAHKRIPMFTHYFGMSPNASPRTATT